MAYAGILQQSAILPRKIVIWIVASIDTAVLALLALFGPIGGAMAIVALTTASYCVFSPIGFVLMSVLISPVYPLGSIDESTTHIAKLLVSGFFLVSTLAQLAIRKRTISIKMGAMEKSLIALLAWGAFCTVFAMHPLDSTKELLRISVFLIVYFLAVETIRERLHLTLILVATLVALLTSSIGSLVSLWNGGFERAHGFFDNPNAFGLFLNFSISVAIMGFVLFRGFLSRLLFGSGVVLGVISLMLSWSRAAILCLGVQGIVYLIIEKKRKTLLGLVTLTLVVAAIVLVSPQLRTVLSTVMRIKSGTTHRTILWETGFKAFVENPVVGLGLRVYTPDVVDKVMWNDFDNIVLYRGMDTIYSPHNVYIGMLVAAGFPGLILFLLLYWCLIGDQWRSRRESSQSNQRTLHTLLVCLLVGTLAHGVFEAASIFSWGPTANYFWIALGMVEAVKRKNLLAEPETTTVAAHS
jgi:putative inorganic carbon (hco3(-)) transporter